MSIFTKAYQAIESTLDGYITKSQSIDLNEDLSKSAVGNNTSAQVAVNPNLERIEHADNDRLGYFEMDTPVNDQGMFREAMGATPNYALKNMARRDAIIMLIHQCLVNQTSNFSQPQVDKYSPGFRFRALKPADLTREDKLKLADPDLSEDDFNALEYEMEQKRAKLHDDQEKDIEKLVEFIKFCGGNRLDTDTLYKRMDFDKFIKLVTRDILTYNYLAVEMIPSKGEAAGVSKGIASFHPVSAGTVKFVSATTIEQSRINRNAILGLLGAHAEKAPEEVPFRYAQVLRGKPVAAWTDANFVFEALYPSVDPEDYSYAQGPLHWLVNTVTNHLYAENHNTNFFRNGTSKGILHIKGNNISRTQLESFRRSWFAQLTGPQNSFRPPVIGMADEVRWVPFTQTNQEMEFQEWMQYLIKIACGAYQIDPAEINFDITKSNPSTLNESNNEQRIKSSKNKGLRPLLMFIQNVINNQILPRYSKELSAKYIFEFVGLDAETKKQEIDRLKDEANVYRTINEIRNEQGLAPVEHGNIILAATYTQYLQTQTQLAQAGENPMDPSQGLQPGQADDAEGNEEIQDEDVAQDDSDIDDDINSILAALDTVPDEKPKAEPKDDVKKALTVEYHHYLKDDK